jgi:hypothetical protein
VNPVATRPFLLLRLPQKSAMRNQLLLSLLGLVLTSCGRSQDESSAATATIKGFYHYYIVETDRTIPQITFNEDTLQTYCTASFLKKWHADHEYDRVLQAQDYYSEWANHLTVVPLNNLAKNAYKVCFLGPLNHCIIVTIKKEQGKWKIDDTQRERDD